MRRGLLCLLVVAGCKSSSGGVPKLDAPFTDDFNRDSLGPDWYNTGGPYRIQNGALVYSMAHNHPLWLQRRLPDNVQVDLDITGRSPEGDLKVELMGDGHTFESDEAVKKDLQFTASGYVFIAGGWHNRLSTLVKQKEHQWQYERGVPVDQKFRVVPNQKMHWTITKRAGHIEWWIDGQPFLTLDDPEPLQGEGHDRFALEGWESEAEVDNLKITPL